MRCPLCAGPLREESANLFTCEVGHQLRGDELHQAATSRASVALWMAIEALESEAVALRSLAERAPADGVADLAAHAEHDARLLRTLSTAHVPPGALPGDHDRPGRLDRAVRAVALFLVAEVPLGETLNRLAVVARDAAGQAMAAGITLLDEAGRPATRVFTDDLSPAIDQAQYDEGIGPCVDAYLVGRVVRVDDIREMAERWPAYAQRAAEHGVRSTLSLPLAAAGDTFGALNLYAGVEHAFSALDEADAEMFATQVSVVLANARAYWEAFDLAQGLRQASNPAA
jgi:GAF domain-containing protein